MAGSHEVRGSIPLGSTTFLSRFQERLFSFPGLFRGDRTREGKTRRWRVFGRARRARSCASARADARIPLGSTTFLSRFQERLFSFPGLFRGIAKRTPRALCRSLRPLGCPVGI